MVPMYQRGPGSLPGGWLETERCNLRWILLCYVSAQYRMWLGCSTPEMLSGPIFCSIWSIPCTCGFTEAKQETFLSPGQAVGSSGMFSMLCSVGSQCRDKVFACRLPVHSWLPPPWPGLQSFPGQISARSPAQAPPAQPPFHTMCR